ncbi:MAG: metal ABC transporter substrate-binding protein, partial [Acidobacteriota bacterium]
MRARMILRILLVVVFLSMASGGALAAEGKKELRILAGTFPMYLFTQNVARGVEGVKVDVMIPPGMGCPHDYALTPADMDKIGKSDVFVANGLGLEGFLGAPLKRANSKIVLIDSSAGVTGLKEMTPEPSDKGHDKHQDAHMNPHLFASPRMAAKVVRNIAEGLAKADPDHAPAYRGNAVTYAAGLDRLADEFAALGTGLKSKRIVTEHAVFDYL